MTTYSRCRASLLSLIGFLALCSEALGFPIDNVPRERTNIIVTLDHTLPQHVHESQFALASENMDVLRYFNIGTEYLGYLASVDSAALNQLLEQLANTYGVLNVESDAIGHIDDVETNAPWGLGRISHRRIIDERQYHEYVHYKEGGEGVKVYLLDSGIYSEHEEFKKEDQGLIPPLPRARLIKNFVKNEWSNEDLNGHGTHCAGTIGGARFGVAKNVDIDVIKVCNAKGECQMSDIIAGLEYAVAEFLHSPKGAGSKGSLISMSLGLPANKSTSLALAARAAVRSGILVVASAGNDAAEACTHTPASVEEVLTVGATNLNDERASFSNFGSCVDLFAPGDSILSASNKGPHRTRVMSGTSMSTPHVSGLVAYYLSIAEDGVFTTPDFIKGFLMSRATPGAIRDTRGAHNLLAFNG